VLRQVMMLLGVLAWAGLWLGVAERWGVWGAWSLAGARTGFLSPHAGFIYPVNTTDEWLDQARRAPAGSRFWINLATGFSHGFVPVPRDRRLEVALVDSAVSNNLTPWTECSITGGDLAPGGLADPEFAAALRRDLDRILGPDWDTPDRQGIACRISIDYGLSGEGLFVYRTPNAPPVLKLGWLEPDNPVTEPIVWLEPALRIWRGGTVLRLGDLTTDGRIWVVEAPTWILGLFLISLPAGVLILWLLTPPYWQHLIRKRRFRRHRCVDCGYPRPPAIVS
jgi:hypothetical protein